MPHVTFFHGTGPMDGQPGTYDAGDEAMRPVGIAPPPAPPVQVGP